jgi:hypothetical protein
MGLFVEVPGHKELLVSNGRVQVVGVVSGSGVGTVYAQSAPKRRDAVVAGGLCWRGGPNYRRVGGQRLSSYG